MIYNPAAKFYEEPRVDIQKDSGIDFQHNLGNQEAPETLDKKALSLKRVEAVFGI